MPYDFHETSNCHEHPCYEVRKKIDCDEKKFNEKNLFLTIAEVSRFK
jgi:hypothetical protein